MLALNVQRARGAISCSLTIHSDVCSCGVDNDSANKEIFAPWNFFYVAYIISESGTVKNIIYSRELLGGFK